MDTAIVGRSDELARLQQAAADASRGRAAVVCIVGEAGIGRTRLAEGAADLAAQVGLPVAWGRAWDGPGTPAYAPWARVLREQAPPPAPAEGIEARFDRLDAWARALERAAPLAVVLDDLHLADAGSAHLLWFVARMLRDARLLVVATWRPDLAERRDGLAAGLAGTLREGRVLRPGPLSRDDVAALTGAAGASLDALVRATGGNPLLLAELRAVGTGRPLAAARARLETVSGTTRRILAVAAAVGTASDRTLLEHLAGEDPSDALDEAVAAGILDDGAFRHELVREAAGAGLPASRRRALRGEAARWLAERPDAEACAAGIARLALDGGLPSLGARFARTAAARALAEGAPEQAEDLLASALHDAGTERAAVLAGLAEARMTVDPGRGRPTCEEALAAARAGGDTASFARAALAMGIGAPFAIVNPRHVAVLEEALQRVDPADRGLRARLQARLASALQPAADPQVPLGLAREAIALAREVGGSALLREVIALSRGAFRSIDPLSERVALDTELLVLAEAQGDAELALDARHHLALDHLERGDGEAARAELERYGREAAGIRRRAIALWDRAFLETYWGTVDAAVEACDAGARTWARLPQAPTPLDPVALGRALLSRWWGRPEGGIAPNLPGSQGMRAWLALERGDPERARAAWKEVRGLTPISGALLVPMAELAARFGTPDEAKALLPWLERLRGRMILFRGPVSSCEGPWDRLCALLADRAGDRRRAAAHWEDAIRLARRFGSEVVLRRVLRDAGREAEAFPDAPPKLERAGSTFTVSWRGRSFHLPDADGLRYLQHLLGRPGQDVHVLELAQLGRRAVSGVPDAGSAGPLLDARAIAAYRARLQELRAAGGPAHEMAFLEAELAGGSGLGGREREAGGSAEKARVNLTQRIRQAIARLGEQDAELDRYLSEHVHTGVSCRFQP